VLGISGDHRKGVVAQTILGWNRIVAGLREFELLRDCPGFPGTGCSRPTTPRVLPSM
jgi:hypothetical protein